MTQKFSRNDLKVLVKECLMEILQDGLRESVARPARRLQEAPDRSEADIRRSTRDKMNFLPSREQMQPRAPAPPRGVAEGISSITSDPIMREILGDTAATTLVEQMGAESRSPGSGPAPRDAASSIVASSDPMDLFSGSADKWASLAFADPIGRH